MRRQNTIRSPERSDCSCGNRTRTSDPRSGSPEPAVRIFGRADCGLSTHIVSDIEATATDIAIISKGRLVAHASPEELLQRVEGKVREWVVPSAELMR